ncbi:DMT family transporter [Stappia sp. F7233]|uniref:DMT family transporter n=1 Tax=Stappia albiluteola TaxID=2758565 RepID=A0A839AGS0_9HYPH|nr:DMT family transporter [Stappia albiluteola]MBA5777739.1 DMT family transporter [Stappia albiluteola]
MPPASLARTKNAPVTSASDLNRTSPLVGILLKVTSALIFTGMIALVKIASERIPIGEILFARNFFGMIPVLVMIAFRGELGAAFATRRPLGHVGRAIVGASAMALWFSALARIPLPDATAISFSAPLMTVFLAWLLLGEAVRIYRWSAVFIGFCGIMVILSPHLSGSDFGDQAASGAIFAFAAACFMSLASVFVRNLTSTERTATIVLWFSALTSLFSLLTLPFGWVVPDAGDALVLVMIGLLGGIGQILLTQSYRYAEASTIAPFEYTTMLWALLVGWLLFEEVPTVEVLLGAAIVISAGIFVIFRERRLGLDRSKAQKASSPSRA